MTAHHSFDVDVARSIVHIRLGGFFTAGDIREFIAARDAAHTRLHCAPNMHSTITDVCDMKIQSQDMVAAFTDMLADPAHRSRRLAFVVAPTLARPQLLRAIGDRGARVFDSHAEAEAWIVAADTSEAA